MTGDDRPDFDRVAFRKASLDLEAGDLTFVANGMLTKVHRAGTCAGEHCWVHNPTSDWPLAGCPVYWSAANRMAYRVCSHDVLHPDVDAVVYANRGRTMSARRQIQRGDPEWHPDCDGCCQGAPRDSRR